MRYKLYYRTLSIFNEKDVNQFIINNQNHEIYVENFGIIKKIKNQWKFLDTEENNFEYYTQNKLLKLLRHILIDYIGITMYFSVKLFIVKEVV